MPLHQRTRRVDAIRWKDTVFSDREIRRRKSEYVMPAAKAMDHIALDGIVTTKKASGLLHLTLKDRLTDGGTGNLHVPHRLKRDDANRDAASCKEMLHIGAFAHPSMSEREILSRHHSGKTGKAGQLFQKVIRSCREKVCAGRDANSKCHAGR